MRGPVTLATRVRRITRLTQDLAGVLAMALLIACATDLTPEDAPHAAEQPLVPGQLVARPARVDLGTIPCGEFREAEVRLTNNGPTPIRMRVEAEPPELFKLAESVGTVDPGASFDLRLRATSSAGVRPGTEIQGRIRLTENPGTSRERLTAIPVRFAPSGAWLDAPTRLDFGQVPLAAPAQEVVAHLKNSGTTETTVTLGLTGDGEISYAGPEELTLAPGAVAQVPLHLRARSLGTQAATLSVAPHASACGGAADIAIGANVIGGAVLVTPGALDLGASDCGKTPLHEVLGIKNFGATRVAFSVSLASGAASTFELDAPLSGQLATDEQRLVTVRAKASTMAVGRTDEELVVTVDGATTTIKLSQEKRGGVIQVTGAAPARTKLGAPTAVTLTVTNAGNAATTIVPSIQTGAELQLVSAAPITVPAGSTMPVDVSALSEQLGARSAVIDFESANPLCAPLPTVPVSTAVYGRAVAGWADRCLELDTRYVLCPWATKARFRLPVGAKAHRQLPCFLPQGETVPQCQDPSTLVVGPRPDLAGIRELAGQAYGRGHALRDDGTVQILATGELVPGLVDAVRLVPLDFAWGFCALRATGAVECWGRGALIRNLLGISAFSPTEVDVPPGARYTVMADGIDLVSDRETERWLVVARKSGVVQWWGTDYGPHPDPQYVGAVYTAPTDAIGLGPAGSGTTVCALTRSRGVWCGSPPLVNLSLVGTVDAVVATPGHQGTMLILADGRVVIANGSGVVPLEHFD